MESMTKLERIAWLSRRDQQKQFNWLMHHYNEESLKDCFYELDGKKAMGADGVSKQEYEKDLEYNIKKLVERMRQMSYIPGPVREVKIPKGDGKLRPLGISNLEDKIVQKMTAKILEAIYEPLFISHSFGFRPGRNCHTAIKAVHQYLFQNEVEIVIDIDLKNFFGTIDHNLLRKVLEMKIKDTRFIRYIARMFKAGILSEGELRRSEEGVPQGSICSPILANIFAHYAIDLWFEKSIKPCCKGRVELFRYADDMIICSETVEDAGWIKEELGKRLELCHLALNEEKTKLVPFSKTKARSGIKQGTFDFLGFTFYWGRSRKGVTIPKVKTRGKTLRTKLKNVKEWIYRERNRLKRKEIWEMFRRKLIGHINYYGVSHNTKYVDIFIQKASEIVFYWLNRRSQKRSLNWEEYRQYRSSYPIPKAVVTVRLF